MFACDFHQPVSLDGAPPGCLCEWYGKPAIYHFTVPEGIRQHEREAFCQTYGEQFARTVADSLSRGLRLRQPPSRTSRYASPIPS